MSDSQKRCPQCGHVLRVDESGRIGHCPHHKLWYEYELRQYRQATSVLHRCQDDGEKIDYKGWKVALAYLDKEQFMLDYQLEDMKEEVRRLEVVKRELIQENKRAKPDRYAR